MRCGWMYYTEKCPEYGLKRLKIPPYISVKISAISYVRRILVHAGNNDYFPGYISRLDTFRIVSGQDTSPAIPPYPQQYYRFSITPIYYLIYTHIISNIQSLFRAHITYICTLYADAITNAYMCGLKYTLAISTKGVLNIGRL